MLLATIYPRIILVFPFRPLLMGVTIYFFRIKTYPPLPFHFLISYFKWKVTIPLFCDRFHCHFRSDFHQNSAVNSGLVNLWMLLSLNHDLLLFGRRMKQGDYSKRGRRVLVTEWEHNLDLLDTLRSQIFIIATWFNEGFFWPDVLKVHSGVLEAQKIKIFQTPLGMRGLHRSSQTPQLQHPSLRLVCVCGGGGGGGGGPGSVTPF